jgi:hypothetical protein
MVATARQSSHPECGSNLADHVDVPTGGRQAEKLTLLGPAQGPPSRRFVSVDDDVVDAKVLVNAKVLVR